MADMVNHPTHYETGKFDGVEDIKKAKWYIDKYIELSVEIEKCKEF